MKKNDIQRVRIERLTTRGKGYAVIEKRRLEVSGAMPGDLVDVRILGMKRHSARVRVEEIIEEGIERIEPQCQHFGICGGCVWQNVPYEAQCRLKAGMVERALASMPGENAPGDIECTPSPDTFFYRNKMEFSFDAPPRDGFVTMLGLHEAGRFDSVFNLERCLLQSEISNHVVCRTRDFALEHGLSVYGLKTHLGLLRFLTIRDGKNTGDLMVNLVTSGDDFPLVGDYAAMIGDIGDGMTTIMRSINSSKGSVAIGDECDILSGNGMITDRIGDYSFRISPNSFFQTNTSQAHNLYEAIRSFCRLDGTQRLLDLYCGTGTIGIYCSSEAKSVTGIELVESAVQDARVNVELNNVDNCMFIAGQVEKILHEDTGKFDVVVCDPPRAGIHPKAMDTLLRMRIPRMVYVSCNVRALPEDLATLSLAGYVIRDVAVFDMSPHTPHVETVVLLEIE